MNWAFRYDGPPDGLIDAVEKYRQEMNLLPDDLAQLTSVETLFKSEMIRVPQKATKVVVVAHGTDLVSPELEKNRPIRRNLQVSIVIR